MRSEILNHYTFFLFRPIAGHAISSTVLFTASETLRDIAAIWWSNIKTD